ncbi:MAG: hypothetical protein A2086_13330 [Spirochaetes bacterium GWD1_27_9]|nr:MAG: hypothetical protein A2Z98_13510 [Spirochaetes bacterium GWB1_27_13]OHD25576.1 MAG: hypothetical protein A2Y34_06900 [Spirochaetes bacterium GWC1_27_15]OHD45921.1 MAG: hypothetical protein A2086_13330 [Spirochaetes bacterium GWD1_27_9]
MKIILVLLLFILTNILFYSEQIYKDEYKFLSYGILPTFAGIATNWKTNPQITIYDSNKYKGHLGYINNATGRNYDFKTFKKLCQSSSDRIYFPFFIYDLRKFPLKINNKEYKWALLLEDYEYLDSLNVFVKEIKKLMDLINFSQDKGLFITLQYESRFNEKIIPYLEKEGISNIGLKKLFNSTNGEKVQVLNGESATGILKIVNNNEDSLKLDFFDIPIYNYIPQQIPPVSGIITLFPQTPFSHINMLARNRNTLNIYTTNIGTIPNLKDNLNCPVIIVVDNKNIRLRKITAKEFEKYKLDFKINKIDIPETIKTYDEPIPLTNNFKNLQVTNIIGAKASNYVLLKSILPDNVQDGFALGFKPYFDVISQQAQKQIDLLIKEKSNLTSEQIIERLKNIRTTIESSTISSLTINSLRTIIDKYYKNTTIKIRSSTNCEDLPDFNGAGLYISKAFSQNENNNVLQKKILKVYSSIWNYNAFLEREYFNIDHKKSGMALLITKSFPNEIANGVIVVRLIKNEQPPKFTININSQPNENLVTNPKGCEIPESILIESNFYYDDSANNTFQNNIQIISESSIGNVFVNRNDTKKILTDIYNHSNILLKKFENKSGYGLDIEFKIVKEDNKLKIYYKQIRLIK